MTIRQTIGRANFVAAVGMLALLVVETHGLKSAVPAFFVSVGFTVWIFFSMKLALGE